MGDLPILAWETRAPARAVALLAAVGFDPGPDGRLVVGGLEVIVVEMDVPDRLRPGGADVLAGALQDAAGPGTRMLAIGVATVDLDRAVPAGDGAAARNLPRDELLGSRAAAGPDPRIVFLEPFTEGRLAATLARHGEGPAALYLEVDPAALPAIRGRLTELGERPRAGRGPFGSQLLASSRHAWEPHLLLVLRDPAAAATPDDAWATIDA